MATKYDHLSKEDLLNILVKRDSERKLGLVWERNTIEHENSLNDDFVALDLIQDLSVGEAPFQNLLIEGDNFDALRYLSIAYKGQVKCICIDPPYNTGNKDFIYNDKYIDKEDSWMHSKWIESLYRRFTLARDLLSDDGVIFVCIDDKNRAKLELMMDQVFPGMRVGTFVWRCRSGANDAKEWFLSVDHECVLCYANKGFSFAGQAKDFSSYSNPDDDHRGVWDSGDLNSNKDYKQRSETFYPLYHTDTDIWYPCDPGSVWRFASEARLANGKKIRTKTMETIVKENRISWPKDEPFVLYETIDALEQAIKDDTAPHNLRIYKLIPELQQLVETGQLKERVLECIEPIDNWVGRRIGLGKPRFKRFLTDLKKTEKPVSTWILPASLKKKDLIEIEELDEVESFQVGYTSEGTTQLNQIVGTKDFPYPKPLSLIKALVNQVTDPDSGHIVLDFYAGSGTAGHAVMDCNSDGGDRTYIMVSSTEATESEPDKNVCRNITQKRLKAAIEGYSYRTKTGVVSVDGLGGNFAYLKTKRIPFTYLHLDIQHDQIWYALQLIHAQEISPFADDKPYQYLEFNKGAVIYLPELNSKSKQIILEYANTTLKSTMIYTWQPGVLAQEIFSEHICIEKIPDYLMDRFGGNK